MVRFYTLRIFEIMQTLENIEIADDSILASVIRLSKKTSVNIYAYRRKKQLDYSAISVQF